MKPETAILQAARRQRGAALVVGLILLLILTLLAMSGMNTASTELAMATNERLRDNAFRASEVGLEQALSVLATVPQNPTVPVDTGPTPVNGSATDRFTTRSQYIDESDQIPGSSTGKFVAFHYAVTATGTSVRDATAVQRGGAFVIGASGGSGENFGSIN